MITGEEARRAVNEITSYCEDTQCSECYILRFCNERENTPNTYTKYNQKYCVMLEIALPVEATTIEEAQKLAESQVRTAFPSLYHDDVSTEDVWQMTDEEENE